VYADLVEQPLRQVLLAQVGAAHDGDVGVAGRGSRLLKGALGAVGDEGVHAAGRHIVGDAMGDDER
jgi:hypothetical protein